MTGRWSRPGFAALTGVVLAAGGLMASACGSDDPPGSDALPLDPAGNGGTDGNPLTPGSGGTSSDAPNPGSNGGTSGEKQPGEIPIAGSGAGAAPGSGGSDGNPGKKNPPKTPTGLQPNCNPPEGAAPTLALEQVTGGLQQPLFVTGVPGDDTRLFVLQKNGAVRVIQDGQLLDEPFINIGGQILNQGERGLLGLAFHPDYADNGLFYLHFSSSQQATNGDGVIAEFKVSADNPNLADPASQRQVLVIDDTEGNHNGGMITFGADGMLYIGMGDGGGGNDQHGPIGNGQSLTTLLGKLLRIDVNGREVNNAYGIPDGNMAAPGQAGTLAEIWAYGLRNPWRFSFDACTRDLYVGDVGQDTVEEIDFLPADAPAGANFGWRIMEGFDCRPNDNVCSEQTRQGLILPVDEYPNPPGMAQASVTGGYVYRGSAIPGLRGAYLYADYAIGSVVRFRIENGQAVDRVDITGQIRPNGTPSQIASFGQDNAGEVYVTTFQPGAVWRVVAAE